MSYKTRYQSYDVRVGLVSDALYFMYNILSPTRTAFVRLNSDGSQAWSKSIGLVSCIKSLAIDDLENSVYFIKYSSSAPMIVGRLKASDGTLVDAQSQ